MVRTVPVGQSPERRSSLRPDPTGRELHGLRRVSKDRVGRLVDGVFAIVMTIKTLLQRGHSVSRRFGAQRYEALELSGRAPVKAVDRRDSDLWVCETDFPQRALYFSL